MIHFVGRCRRLTSQYGPFFLHASHRDILALCNKYDIYIHMARQYNANNTYSCSRSVRLASQRSSNIRYLTAAMVGRYVENGLMRFFMGGGGESEILHYLEIIMRENWDYVRLLFFSIYGPFYSMRTFTFRSCSLPRSPVTARTYSTVRDVILTWQVRALHFREWNCFPLPT